MALQLNYSYSICTAESCIHLCRILFTISAAATSENRCVFHTCIFSPRLGPSMNLVMHSLSWCIFAENKIIHVSCDTSEPQRTARMTMNGEKNKIYFILYFVCDYYCCCCCYVFGKSEPKKKWKTSKVIWLGKSGLWLLRLFALHAGRHKQQSTAHIRRNINGSVSSTLPINKWNSCFSFYVCRIRMCTAMLILRILWIWKMQQFHFYGILSPVLLFFSFQGGDQKNEKPFRRKVKKKRNSILNT